MVKSEYKPSGRSGWGLSWFLYHEATRNISTPLWMGFAVTHLYTWVARGTVRVKCLDQEHNTISLARARAQTARSGDDHTNSETTGPPQVC